MAKQLVEAVSVTQSFKGSAFWMVRQLSSRWFCCSSNSKLEALVAVAPAAAAKG
jgi:hypothetical protein